METYLPITEAATMTQVTVQVLYQLVSSGKIRATMLGTTGAILVNEQDVKAKIPIKNRPEYQSFISLAGNAISLSDAARKYNIAQQTISRWVAKGFITRLGQQGRKVMIDEAEIATYAEIYRASGGAHGRWIFDQDGLPYSKK